MLEPSPNHLFIYVIRRDFGFAPNPFHGYCTLATCKPGIRRSARVGDWVMGVGGARLRARGRCICLMRVTRVLSFDDYWRDPAFRVKKPLRNGSLVMMVGDNVYHRDEASEKWVQEDSHHSRPDGSANMTNLAIDTSSENVLISEHFYYFGSSPPEVDLGSIRYENVRNFRKMPLGAHGVRAFIAQIEAAHHQHLNHVAADPFDLSRASHRADQSTGRLSP
jgi:hypothetical protein